MSDTMNLTNACRVCGAWAQTGDERCNECVAQNRTPAPPDGAPTIGRDWHFDEVSRTFEPAARVAEVLSVEDIAILRRGSAHHGGLRDLIASHESLRASLLALRAERDEASIALAALDKDYGVLLAERNAMEAENAELRAQRDMLDAEVLRTSEALGEGPYGSISEHAAALVAELAVFRSAANTPACDEDTHYWSDATLDVGTPCNCGKSLWKTRYALSGDGQ